MASWPFCFFFIPTACHYRDLLNTETHLFTLSVHIILTLSINVRNTNNNVLFSIPASGFGYVHYDALLGHFGQRQLTVSWLCLTVTTTGTGRVINQQWPNLMTFFILIPDFSSFLLWAQLTFAASNINMTVLKQNVKAWSLNKIIWDTDNLAFSYSNTLGNNWCVVSVSA